MNVEFRVWHCQAVGARYRNNDAKAIELVDRVTNEPVATATVNLPNFQLMDDEVFIKDYSENTGMVEALYIAGVIEPEAIQTVPSGFVQISAYKLTDQAIKELWPT